MQCAHCEQFNLLKAKYCKSCGKPFTDEQREEAYNQTIYGKLDKLEEMKGWIDFSNITSHPLVRIAVIVILGVMVLFNLSRNGNHIAIRNSEEYTLAYQEETNEYYVLTDLDVVHLNVYLPRDIQTISVGTYVDETCVDYQTFENNEIVLSKNDNSYYVLTGEKENGNTENLLFFVCQ